MIAFFLPQFHVVPENEVWWGEGFTDWTNTKKAAPLFIDHAQPRTPLDGTFFDLTDISELKGQARQAQRYGIDAFCIYYYWFQGRRLLEKPLDLYSDLSGVIPFCLSWANENWTRRWDGKGSEVLIAQRYGAKTASEIFSDFSKYFHKDLYLKIDGRPVFLVHRVADLPDPSGFAETWRTLAQQDGWPDLYLVACETSPGLDPAAIKFDATAEFPPVGMNTLRNAVWRAPRGLSGEFAGRLFSYPKLARHQGQRRSPRFPRHRGVMPGWDNSARRGLSATIYLDESPRQYQRWLELAFASESRARGERGLVFINAWNEWAEGAYLQPDTANGLDYLEATRGALGLGHFTERGSSTRTDSRRTWAPNRPMLRSWGLTLGSSMLSAGRNLHARLQLR